MKLVDLHTHSHFSDGGLSPTELVEQAKEAGLTALALTDHDTVDGLDEAVAAGKVQEVELIPGIELSTTLNGKDLHILGYFIDRTNQTLLAELNRLQEGRDLKAKNLIQGFQELGYKIDFGDIRSKTNGSIGRPHIAVALVENPDNAQRLKEDFGQEVTLADVGLIFEKYLGGDCEFYKERSRVGVFLKTREGIDLIHQAGGLAFLAHPSWDYTKIEGEKVTFEGDQDIAKLQQMGLDGLEVLNFRESSETTQKIVGHYEGLAKQLGLLLSGGSDFHGFGDAGKSLGLKLENILIDYDKVTAMKAKLSVV